jgi:hypothetical protein
MPAWQWALSSLLVPVVVGMAAAALTHFLSLRKTRAELRITSRRLTFEELLPALGTLHEADARDVRLAYHEMGSQAGEDRERQAAEEWLSRRLAALEVIERVRLRGQLGASAPVLAVLDELIEGRSDVKKAYCAHSAEVAHRFRSKPNTVTVQAERVGAKRRGRPPQDDGMFGFRSTSSRVSESAFASILPSVRS